MADEVSAIDRVRAAVERDAAQLEAAKLRAVLAAAAPTLDIDAEVARVTGLTAGYGEVLGEAAYTLAAAGNDTGGAPDTSEASEPTAAEGAATGGFPASPPSAPAPEPPPEPPPAGGPMAARSSSAGMVSTTDSAINEATEKLLADRDQSIGPGQF